MDKKINSYLLRRNTSVFHFRSRKKKTSTNLCMTWWRTASLRNASLSSSGSKGDNSPCRGFVWCSIRVICSQQSQEKKLQAKKVTSFLATTQWKRSENMHSNAPFLHPRKCCYFVVLSWVRDSTKVTKLWLKGGRQTCYVCNHSLWHKNIQAVKRKIVGVKMNFTSGICPRITHWF